MSRLWQKNTSNDKDKNRCLGFDKEAVLDELAAILKWLVMRILELRTMNSDSNLVVHTLVMGHAVA